MLHEIWDDVSADYCSLSVFWVNIVDSSVEMQLSTIFQTRMFIRSNLMPTRPCACTDTCTHLMADVQPDIVTHNEDASVVNGERTSTTSVSMDAIWSAHSGRCNKLLYMSEPTHVSNVNSEICARLPCSLSIRAQKPSLFASASRSMACSSIIIEVSHRSFVRGAVTSTAPILWMLSYFKKNEKHLIFSSRGIRGDTMASSMCGDNMSLCQLRVRWYLFSLLSILNTQIR